VFRTGKTQPLCSHNHLPYDHARSCRWTVDRWKTEPPERVAAVVDAAVGQDLDHTSGCRSSVVAGRLARRCGKDGIRPTTILPTTGTADADRQTPTFAVGRAAAGIPDARDAVIARTVAEVVHGIPADRQAVVGLTTKRDAAL